MSLLKIISGRTDPGVDRGALQAAFALGVSCGGWCPEGRLVEDGVIPEFYPVTEIAGGYLAGTLRNVTDSDGTVILYFGELEGDTEQTMLLLHREGKTLQATRLLLDTRQRESGTALRRHLQRARFTKRVRLRHTHFVGSCPVCPRPTNSSFATPRRLWSCRRARVPCPTGLCSQPAAIVGEVLKENGTAKRILGFPP